MNRTERMRTCEPLGETRRDGRRFQNLKFLKRFAIGKHFERERERHDFHSKTIETKIMDTMSTQLDTVREKIARWTQHQMNEVDDTVESHVSRMREANGKISALENKYSEIHAQMEASSEEFAKNSEVLQRAMETKDELETKMSMVPKEISSHEAQEAAMAKRVEELEKELRAKKVETMRKLSGLQAQVKNFERLGLRFMRLEDGATLVVSFIYIDPQKPLREFAVGLQINDDDEYEVSTCAPAVQNLSSIVAKLNTSNCFSAFILNLRSAFKDTL